MCGIFGYVGKSSAKEIVLNGIKLLEYRGYDSAGTALIGNDGDIYYKKRKGHIDELEKALDESVDGKVGIAHTRWATHGEPNEVNAHPHLSEDEDFAIVHNGIIENYSILKKQLQDKGHTFKSETDTEVLVHLIEEMYKKEKSFEKAVRKALSLVEGTYGILALCKYEPDTLITCRKGSPIVVGIGQNEYFVASDYTPIVEYTKSVVFLNDYDIAVLKKSSFTLKSLIKDQKLTPKVEDIDIEKGSLGKGEHKHYMLKEIYEQPDSIFDCTRGRVRDDAKKIVLGGILDHLDKIAQAKRIIIVACGTSWHAGLVGEYLFESIAKVPVEVEYASEFRYRDPIINKEDVVIAISQSGETADTLAAIELAKKRGALVIGVCNVVGSSISRETEAGVYTHAGPEISVASTKSFTSQVTVLTMISLLLGQKKGVLDHKDQKTKIFESVFHDLVNIKFLIEKTLKNCSGIEEIAEKFKDSRDFMYFGRGINFPVALEGALKLKEISYIHAEGYPAAEMKHGPIALIDKDMPVVFIAPKDSLYEKTISNIMEVKARSGKVISIVTEGEVEVREISDYVIEIPETSEAISPVLSIIPLQLLAYYIADLSGLDVDKPRNLAKSVTVE